MVSEARTATVKRTTGETDVKVSVNLDGGPATINTGIAFFDHMLDQIARHGGIGLDVQAQGDLEVDDHHTVEDTGIAMGEAVRTALGNLAGIFRFGTAYAPLDESLARTVVDLSGRPGLFFRATFSRPTVGEFEVQLIREFFGAFANASKTTIHVDLLEGVNAHHQVEAVFKSFALALRKAVTVRDVTAGVPSTKGSL